MNFSFWTQWRWAFEVFKWTDESIFKSETTKMKLVKNMKNIKKDF